MAASSAKTIAAITSTLALTEDSATTPITRTYEYELHEVGPAKKSATNSTCMIADATATSSRTVAGLSGSARSSRGRARTARKINHPLAANQNATTLPKKYLSGTRYQK